MPVKADKMLKDLERLGLKPPQYGTGRNGKILNSDIQAVLAAHFFNQHERSHGYFMRMNLNEVMLAYRGDALTEKEVEHVFSNNSGWIAEEKYNGCRVVITSYPGEGFRVFGRNRSKFDYLPIDYSDKVWVKQFNCTIDKIKPRYTMTRPFMLDCELITSGNIETMSGVFTEKGVNTATALLTTDKETSLLHQRTGAEFTCVCFDMLFTLNPDVLLSALNEDEIFEHRRQNLEDFFTSHGELMKPFFQLSLARHTSKKIFFETLLAQGKEGVILKNLKAPYIRGLNGYRPKTAVIKFKRTMSGSLGSDIDCYVAGYTTSEHYDTHGLIAGIKLAVKLRDNDGKIKEHWIATVSAMPDSMRDLMSYKKQKGGACLQADFYGKVLTIDGQDISARNRRISHAKARWDTGFREDKGPADCIIDADFIESQVF